MYKDYLDKCMPSQAMREYLKTATLSGWQTASLIMYAPVSLTIKAEELKAVLLDPEVRQDEDMIDECRIAITNVEKAVEYLNAEGVFTVKICEYSETEHDSVGHFACVCGSIEDVQEYISNDINNCEGGACSLRWYAADKWMKDHLGKYVLACSYIIFRDEVIYGEIEAKVSGVDLANIYNTYSSRDLNLPVPFKAGDILEFDGFPFGPKSHVLILSVGDNIDHCCLQGLALNANNLWECGAVKHGMVSINYNPKYSYLYSAKIFDGELDSREQILRNISDYISGDEDCGKMLCAKMQKKMSERQLRNIVFPEDDRSQHIPHRKGVLSSGYEILVGPKSQAGFQNLGQ